MKTQTGRTAINDDIKGRLWFVSSGRCWYCGVPCNPYGEHDRPEFDHIVPVSKGGSGDIANLALSCHGCNKDKAARYVNEWRESCLSTGWPWISEDGRFWFELDNGFASRRLAEVRSYRTRNGSTEQGS